MLVITQDGRTIVVRSLTYPPRLLTVPADLLKAKHSPSPTPPLIRLVLDAQGNLEGFDQTINVILSNSIERVYSVDEPVEEVPLGLYVVRGDNIVSTAILVARCLAVRSIPKYLLYLKLTNSCRPCRL